MYKCRLVSDQAMESCSRKRLPISIVFLVDGSQFVSAVWLAAPISAQRSTLCVPFPIGLLRLLALCYAY